MHPMCTQNPVLQAGFLFVFRQYWFLQRQDDSKHHLREIFDLDTTTSELAVGIANILLSVVRLRLRSVDDISKRNCFQIRKRYLKNDRVLIFTVPI
jgi:hypothetical protein